MCGGSDHGGGLYEREGRSKPFTQRRRAGRAGDCILPYADSNPPQVILREGVAIEDALEVTRCRQEFPSNTDPPECVILGNCLE